MTAGDPILRLLDSSPRLAPDDLVDLLVDTGLRLGARDVLLYLVDYGQSRLMPVRPEPRTEEDQGLAIEGTMAGRAFTTQEVVVAERSNDLGRRAWIPLINGVDRLGVLEVTLRGDGDEGLSGLRRLAALAARLVVNVGSCGDRFAVVRRRREMTLASEMQWQLLPPLSMAAGNVAIAGFVEPAYEVGGDAFDAAINSDLAHVAIFDAMGHSLPASLLASVAVAAYRHARRSHLDLPASVRDIDAALRSQFDGERFLTAQLARLERDHGRLRWVNAGHPPPLLVRQDRVAGELTCPPTLPLGWGEATEVTVAQESLEPGDRVVFYSDGIIEGRKNGDPFGVERLADWLERELQSGRGHAEVMRRLKAAIVEHHQGKLSDDATVVSLEWAGPGQAAGVTGIVT